MPRFKLSPNTTIATGLSCARWSYWYSGATGASVQARRKSNNTPLHHAAQNSHTGRVELLLRKGASIEAVSENNDTPLQLAERSGHTGTLQLLQNRPAELGLYRNSTWIGAEVMGDEEKVWH